MIFLYLLTIILPCSIVSSIKLCNTANDICETIPEDLNQEAIKKVEAWWQQMSEKKPLKCSGKTLHDEQFFEGPSIPIFQTYKCGDMQPYGAPQIYSFKGRIENFRFQGPGKFKLGDIDADGHTEGTCFSRWLLNKANITTIVGNFKDGKPHGIAKLELDDGSTHIGKFREGARHGLYRHWNANGTLVEVGYWFNGKQVGRMWKVQENENGTLYFMPTTTTLYSGRQFVDHSQTLAFVRNFSMVLAGEMTFRVVRNARYAKIDSTKIEDCYLIPEWTLLEGERFKFLGQKNELRYQKGEAEPHPFCSEESVDTDKIGTNLNDWLSKLGSYSFDGLWQAEPSDEPLTKDALKIIDHIQHEKGNNFTCSLLGSTERISFTAKRYQTEEDESLHGIVQLNFNITANVPRIPFLNLTFSKLEGYMNNGELQGTVLFSLQDELYLNAKVRDNAMHGLSVKLGVKTELPRAAEYGPDHYLVRQQGIGLIGKFRNGRPDGIFWIGTIGGGFLYGPLDENRKFTGDHMAYIYPDLEIAFYGRFEDKVMKSGRKSHVISEECNQDGIKTLTFAKAEGASIFYSPPTNVSYGEGPQTMDPYEEKYVRLAPSGVPAAGQGVFAVRDINSSQLACPYSGFIYRNREEQDIYKQRYTYNTSLSDYDRRWATKYSISVGNGQSRLEIPIEMDRPGAWMPTTAQKINCDFPKRRANVHFDHFEHPRYGLIMGAFASKDIMAGQELFTDYGYTSTGEFPFDFPWYHEEKKKYLDEMKQLEALELKEEAKKSKRPKAKIGKNKKKKLEMTKSLKRSAFWLKKQCETEM